MARRVFISFRFGDGKVYKDELCELFDKDDDVIDCSEDTDRSNMTEETIQTYLYDKLKRTSITVVILTPMAVSHKKNWLGQYNDWMYDELRYSLDNRTNNATNGVVAVYTEEARDQLYYMTTHKCSVCNEESSVKTLCDFDNLVRKNMMNIKPLYKKNECPNIYDSLEDSYISLVSLDDFKGNPNKYIDNAASKRERKDEFDLVKRL